MKKAIIISIVVILLILGGILYGYNRVYNSQSSNLSKVTFEVKKGEGLLSVAERLDEKDLVSGKIFFYYYMKNNGLLNKILPGVYDIGAQLTIPEIAIILTKEIKSSVKVTFPEGWNIKQMAERLTKNDLDGDGFLKLANSPKEFQDEFSFLKDEEVRSLEGFLFPDTYLFKENIEARDIIIKLLRNFENKLSDELVQNIKKQDRSLFEIITMASLIEKEVVNAQDREIVSGIFWGRIKIGQALQSCATLAYVLGVNKKQYTYADTEIVSPYNTYQNRGLPPGPIANPGIAAIFASANPKYTTYNYFLSDINTGETVFSKTLDEHNMNKVRHGL